LGNNQGNFQLHRFTRKENTAKSFRGLLFLTHTVDASVSQCYSVFFFVKKLDAFHNLRKRIRQWMI